MLQDDCEPLEGEKVVKIQTSDVGKLPAPLTTFVGRSHDLAEVRDRLGATRLLTLTGAGGVGKTRLALEVAGSAMEFADGVWLVDLAPLRDPSLTANVTAIALGMPDLGIGPVIDQLAAFLTRRRALIVLDNCEHLVDACADLAHALLSACPALRILGDEPPSAGNLWRARLRRSSAGAGRRGGAAAGPGHRRQPGVPGQRRQPRPGPSAVRRPGRAAAGYRAGRVPAADPHRRRGREPAGEPLRTAYERQPGGPATSADATRVDRLEPRAVHPGERLLWHRLSVFAGDFGLDAAEAVCAGYGIGRDEVLDLLDRLVVQSVVLPCERDGLPRYRLLATIRQYGRERLAESGQERRTLRRHHDFYLALAERVADGWYGPGQKEALARLRAEHANLLAALAYGDDPQATLALAAALRFHWCAGGFLAEGRRQLDRALAAAPEPSPARSRALCAASWVALLQGDHGAAERWLAEAGELGEQQDDRVLCAHVVGLRGSLAAFQGRLAQAVPLFERAVAAHTAAGDEASAVFELFQLAAVQMDLRNPLGAGDRPAGGRPGGGARRVLGARACDVDAELRRLEAG
ncbi:LuxR family transcriptional regulator [Streptomyces mirabilis]|nr:LuxR family transcriptional regulator [Streptomyces mirabilis]